MVVTNNGGPLRSSKITGYTRWFITEPARKAPLETVWRGQALSNSCRWLDKPSVSHNQSWANSTNQINRRRAWPAVVPDSISNLPKPVKRREQTFQFRKGPWCLSVFFLNWIYYPVLNKLLFAASKLTSRRFHCCSQMKISFSCHLSHLSHAHSWQQFPTGHCSDQPLCVRP